MQKKKKPVKSALELAPLEMKIFAVCFLITTILFFITSKEGTYAFVSLFFLFGAYIIFIFLRPEAAQKELMEGWEKAKSSGLMKVDKKLRLSRGERIVIGLTPSFIRSSGLSKYSQHPGDIITTNKRMAIGFQSYMLITPMKESFDSPWNLWFSKRMRTGFFSHAMTETLGRDSVVEQMGIFSDGKKKYLHVEAKYGPTMMTFDVYNRKIKEIEKAYLKSKSR